MLRPRSSARSAVRRSMTSWVTQQSSQLVRLSSTLASSPYTSSTSSTHTTTADAPHTTTDYSLNAEQRSKLGAMLRVDHAGEIAANTIYLAQARTFAALGDHTTAKMMMDMLETEKKHLHVVEKLLAQHRVRPSALNAVWGMAGSVLGGATALLGKEGAMAATEAVETVIGEHYDDGGSGDITDAHSTAQKQHPSLALLSEVIREFRDDELEHLDTAVEHDAQQAPAHALLSAIIGFGCKGAIQIAKRF